ncbi:MAG: VWA domain-containing protein [Paludibacteraceae bacterium]|nr:VWA domain-containing protein [Paludibacteraceae bacterium]
MFRFVNIDVLWWLCTIPVFVAGYVAYTIYKKRQLSEFGDPELVAQLMPDASKSRSIWKFSLVMLAFALLIVAAARPLYGKNKVKEEQKNVGIEVMVALDISNSMLAEDVAPNRLGRAKQLISKLVDDMDEDKMGLVVFAGEAFTQLPITCDQTSAKMFLNTISPNLIRMQGTAIGAALHTSILSFGEENKKVGRAIILITDGENHEDDAVAMAQKAYDLGIQVFVIGVGKPEGAPIPISGTHDFIKDASGQIVMTSLNEEMCKQIAQAGKGVYVRCDDTNTALKTLQKGLDEIEASELDPTRYSNLNEQYQSFVLLAFVILIIEFFMMSRKNHRLIRMDIFKEYKLKRKK